MIKKVTPSEKLKLKARLRKLDKQLYRFWWFTISTCSVTNHHIFPGMYEKLAKLDEKRKEVRNKLK